MAEDTTAVSPDELTVAELDEQYGDLEGYPTNENKPEKVAFVEAHLAGDEGDQGGGFEGDREIGTPQKVSEPEFAADADYAAPPFKDEVYPHIHVGDWVRLGTTNNVPEELWGHLAYVTDAPVLAHEYCSESPRYHEHQDPNVPITVQTRDDQSAIITIHRGDIMKHATDRVYLENHG